jgi:hypothetical protein
MLLRLQHTLQVQGTLQVHKTCEYKCDFKRDEDALAYAHAWVAETVNHEKFLGQGKAREVPVPMPPMRRAPYADSYYAGQAVPPTRQLVEDHFGQALVPKVRAAAGLKCR